MLDNGCPNMTVYCASLGKLHQCVFGHWDVVTSLSYAIDAIGNNINDAVVVSGSRDATLLVWHWNDKQQRISANGRPGLCRLDEGFKQ